MTLLGLSLLLLASPAAGADALAALIRQLEDGSAAARLAAATELGELGEEAALAVPALGRALRDDDRRVRDLAALALGNIGAAAASAVPQLTRGLEDRDGGVRASAALALWMIGPAARPAIPRLLDCLVVPPVDAVSVALHNNALGALRALGIERRHVPRLLELGARSSRQTRLSVILVLAAGGAESEAALPFLEAARADPDETLRAATEAAVLAVRRALEAAAGRKTMGARGGERAEASRHG